MIYLISHAPCVATYLRCGGDVNNQIRKGFLLSLPVKKSKIGECLATLQARTWLTRALSSSFLHRVGQADKVSQGSVATYARTGGSFNNQFTNNLLRNLHWKDFVNRLRFERIMAMRLWPHFFGPPYTQITPTNQHASCASGWVWIPSWQIFKLRTPRF